MLRIAAVATVVALFAVGCANQDRNASIEASNKGIALLRNREYASAEKEFLKAVELYPENHQAWANLGQVRQARDDWKGAAEAYAGAVKYAPNEPMYHYLLGRALYESWAAGTGGSLDLAQTHLEKAIEINPRLFKAHYYLGKVYDMKDDPAKAAEHWTEAAKLDAGFGKALLDLGKLYLRWDFIPQAIAVLEQGTLGHVLDPADLSNIYFYLGLAYEAQENYSKAVEAYTKALEAQKGNLDAKLQRGFSYVKLGDKAKAKADLEDYVKQKGSVTGEAPGLEVQAANDMLMRLMAM